MGRRLNKKQLAKFFRKSIRTIERWTSRGWLPRPLSDKGWPTWDSDEIEKVRSKTPQLQK